MLNSSSNHFAQIINPQINEAVARLSPTQFFNRLIPNFINIGLIIGVIVFVFILILGGIGWVTSAGDRGKVEEARNKITQALTGLAVLFFFFALVQFLNLGLGINIGNLGVAHIGGLPPAPPTIPAFTATPTFTPTPGIEPPEPPITTGYCLDNESSCSCNCPAGYNVSVPCSASPPNCSTDSCTCTSSSLTCTTDVEIPTSLYGGATGIFIMAQSFTPTITGNLEYVQLCLNPDKERLIEIREGEDIDGPNPSLATSVAVVNTGLNCVSSPWAPYARLLTVIFDTHPTLNAGSLYTLKSTEDPPESLWEHSWPNNPYPGGRAIMCNPAGGGTCSWQPETDLIGIRVRLCSSSVCSDPGESCTTTADCCQPEEGLCTCNYSPRDLDSVCVCTAPPPLPTTCTSDYDCRTEEYSDCWSPCQTDADCDSDLLCAPSRPPAPEGRYCMGLRCPDCVTNTDSDGDGYLPLAQTGEEGHCQSTPADCNDNNLDVHPDQFIYFEVPIPGTTNDFNYDCADADNDGNFNDKHPFHACRQTTLAVSSCRTSPLPGTIIQAGWVGGIPNCGESWSGNFLRVCASWVNSSTCGNFSRTAGADCGNENPSQPLCLTDPETDSYSTGDIPYFAPGSTAMPCK